MKRNIRQCLIVAATALSFAACDVKDPIYNTPHPEQGAIPLVTDWSGIGEGLTAPASYTVEAGDYSAILIGTTGVEATTHAVDATTGNQGEREGNRSSRQRRDDLHEAEDGDRNQVAREVLLERRQLLNRRVVEHEQRIHRRGEEVVFLRQSHTHAVYME